MRERLARALAEGTSGEAADRVLRASFWSHPQTVRVAEVVDLASRAAHRREGAIRAD
jgi:hypothetical protein